MIDDLKRNIEVEIQILRELNRFSERVENERGKEKRIYSEMVNSLTKRIKLVNNSIPEIIRNISLTKKIPSKESEKINFNSQKSSKNGMAGGIKGPDLILKGGDKHSYLKELNINENLLKKLLKTESKKKTEKQIYRKPSKFAKYSNKYFFEKADEMVRKGDFKDLSSDLRKSNLNILTTTYVSMMFLGIAISVFLGIFSMIFLMFFEIGFAPPFFSVYDGNFLTRFVKVFWVMIVIPIVAFFIFYTYPGAEKKTIGGRINQELPFAVIHMASISGSGIQPIDIFKIIGMSKEYKYLGPEMKKIINQTNVYGYDLTNALKNVARATPSKRLAELLNGISVTIHSGGNISSFFEKRGESLLLEYRVEREKYAKTTETFMDLYISIVIAAPMILLMLLIMISVADIGLGFSVAQLSTAIVGVVAIINIGFLTFLHLKQPGY